MAVAGCFVTDYPAKAVNWAAYALGGLVGLIGVTVIGIIAMMVLVGIGGLVLMFIGPAVANVVSGVGYLISVLLGV